MKTIGFVDYYIGEWHADNYPAWITAANEQLGLDFCLKYVWAEQDVSPRDGRTTDDWCSSFGCERCMSIEEICEKSDALVVLAPSNPEKHLEYAKTVLKYKKPTFIDKTFADNYASAKAIFDIAAENGTPFFSSSALRYADEIEDLSGSRSIMITGGGRSFDEYIVHQLEMVVKITSCGEFSVCGGKQGDQAICRVSFEDGTAASFIYAPPLPFTICAEKDGESVYRPIKSDYFKKLIADMLRFFDCGKPSFDPAETLRVMALRDALIKTIEA